MLEIQRIDVIISKLNKCLMKNMIVDVVDLIL